MERSSYFPAVISGCQVSFYMLLKLLSEWAISISWSTSEGAEQFTSFSLSRCNSCTGNEGFNRNHSIVISIYKEQEKIYKICVTVRRLPRKLDENKEYEKTARAYSCTQCIRTVQNLANSFFILPPSLVTESLFVWKFRRVLHLVYSSVLNLLWLFIISQSTIRVDKAITWETFFI